MTEIILCRADFVKNCRNMLNPKVMQIPIPDTACLNRVAVFPEQLGLSLQNSTLKAVIKS